MKNLEYKLKKKVWNFFRRAGYDIKKSENFWLEDLQALFSGKPVEVIIDAGANVGSMTKCFRDTFSDAAIHAFEPFPSSFEKLGLRKDLGAEVFLNETALYSHSGDIEFHVAGQSDSSSVLQGNVDAVPESYKTALAPSQKIKVKATTLDEYASVHGLSNINLLKMDLQGGEMNALRGSVELLASSKIDVIYTECYFMPFYKNQELFEDISNFLAKYEYKLFYLYNSVYGSRTGRLQWCDAIFVSSDISFDKTKLMSFS